MVSLENSAMAANARSKKAKLWFSKVAFDGLDNDEDDDLELDQMVANHKGGKKKTAISKTSENEKEEKAEKVAVSKNAKEAPVIVENEPEVSDDDSVESDDGGGSSTEDDRSYNSSDSDSEEERLLIEQAKAAARKSRTDSSTIEQGKERKDDGSFEVVPANSQSNMHRVRKLDPEGLAIGALMVQSKKKREELIESGYNRWTHNDDNLPDWFLADESKYCQKTLPITKEMVEVYRAKLKEINSRPIKKIAEAKARKKKRALKKLEKVRKKAESIADLGEDVSAQEKAQQIKQVYKKAGVLGKRKREVEYVVAKKGVGKRVKRPAGVKGHFKVVDPRMKKDTRGKAVARGKSQRSGGQQKKRKH